MTVSVSSLDHAGWRGLRARRAFVVRALTAPALRRARMRRAAWLCALALGATVALVAALYPFRPEPAPTAPATPPPSPAATGPAWTDVSHPFVAYDLAGGPYAKLPLRYAARRDHVGEAREDTLTFGLARPGEAFLRVAFLRRGAEQPASLSVFVDAARLAAGAGLAVTRSGLGARLDTRFGPFDMAGVAVEHRGRTADCLAFRLADPAAAPVLGITGLACGTVEHPLDAVTLACTLDRLDLVSAGDDEALRAVFVAAERRRRDGCATRPPVPLRFGAADAPHGLMRGTL